MDCPPEESGRCGAEVTRQWRFDCTEISATMRQLFAANFVLTSESLSFIGQL